jgi:hypothetical protein
MDSALNRNPFSQVGGPRQSMIGEVQSCVKHARERLCQVARLVDGAMKKSKSRYHGHRFSAVIISCAVRWYFNFQLSLRDIEELLFERGVIVTYETIRC